MNTTAHETQITADERVPMIRIVREFDAPREKVFRAHSDPELLKQWLGPRDRRVDVEHFDCRTGGSWRYVMPTLDGSDPEGFHGCFHIVRPNEVIVQTFTWDGVPDGVALDRMTLEDLGDGRTRLTLTSLLESFEARDAMLASGMEGGVRDGFEKLDALLAKQS
jgi:uncharacterized protein YndB with AHSA1/START domain